MLSMRIWHQSLVPLDNIAKLPSWTYETYPVNILFHDNKYKPGLNPTSAVIFLLLANEQHSICKQASIEQLPVFCWANDPGGAGKTVSCSCCVGMIIEMVKSGAPMSVKVHHVQLIAQSLSALALVGRVGSSTLSTFSWILVILVLSLSIWVKPQHSLSTRCYL